MAIIIPSKNIYEIDNPKIIDNIIDNVSVEQTIVKPNNDYDVTVYNEDIDILSKFISIAGDPDKKDKSTIVNQKSFAIQGGNFIYWFFCSHTEYRNYFLGWKITIKIPKIKDNSFINKLYYGINDKGENNIKYSLIGTKESGIARADVSFTGGIFGAPSDISIGNISLSNPTVTGKDERIEIPKKVEFIYEGSFDNELTSGEGSATSTSILYDAPNTIATVKPTDYIENGVEYYKLEFDVLGGVTIIRMGGDNIESPISVVGKYERYRAQSMEVTIYGNTIGINLTDGSVTYGNGNKPYSLSRNELLQDSGEVGEIALTEHLAENVLNQYTKGKQTATLLCSISDYYDESGEKVIDTKTNKMSFRLHDEVIPYVYGADGKDKPMSKNQDGSAKVFEVVGSNIIYDGAVWQELTLLEKTQNN